MALDLNLPSPIEVIKYELFERHNVKVRVKRDDLIHPEISGNKWRKLKLNIEKFKENRYESLLTFGGAYSNHISATAAIGREMNIPTIGVIRGDELNASSNDTLGKAQKDGMQLVFVSREEYGLRYETSYKHELRRRFGNTLIVEEGGANFLGVMGCTEIVSEIHDEPDYFIIAAGTGTTTAGLLMGVDHSKIISVPVFKKGDFIRDEINQLLEFSGLGEFELIEKMNLLSLATEFSFGGYGKFNKTLINFMNEIYSATGLKLDQIYTGKMFYALCEQVKSGIIPSGSSVIAIHTGGIQGTNSIKDQLLF